MPTTTSSIAIPAEWQGLLADLERGTILILGERGTGKSRLSRFLLGQLDRPLRRVALIDTDADTPSIGVPTCLGLALTGPWEAPAALWFVGEFCCRRRPLPAVAGVQALLDRAYREGAEAAIVDASGLAGGDPDLAFHLAVASRVDQIVAIQRERELEAVLDLLAGRGRSVHRVTAPRLAREDPEAQRGEHRRGRLQAHFHGAEIHRFGLRQLRGYGGKTGNGHGAPPPRPATVVGLIGAEGICLALGVVDEVKPDHIAVLTPWKDSTTVRRLIPGSVRIATEAWDRA